MESETKDILIVPAIDEEAQKEAAHDSGASSCLIGFQEVFLVELGAIAANRLRDFNGAGIRVVILGVVVPLINGSIGAVLGSAAGMSVGGVAVMATLAASASYIAAPAAIRIALPDASPGIYVTASLGITFPFNLIVGIPLYIEIAELLV